MTAICGAKVRTVNVEKSHVVWVSTWVALLQLVTTLLLFLGWVWSIYWAVCFVKTSNECLESQQPSSQTARSVTMTTTVVSGNGRTAATRNAMGMGEAPAAPIIVLQEAPLVLRADMFLDSPEPLPVTVAPNRNQRPLNPYNPRHQRAIRQRQEIDAATDTLFTLNNQQLEDLMSNDPLTPSTDEQNRQKTSIVASPPLQPAHENADPVARRQGIDSARAGRSLHISTPRPTGSAGSGGLSLPGSILLV